MHSQWAASPRGVGPMVVYPAAIGRPTPPATSPSASPTSSPPRGTHRTGRAPRRKTAEAGFHQQHQANAAAAEPAYNQPHHWQQQPTYYAHPAVANWPTLAPPSHPAFVHPPPLHALMAAPMWSPVPPQPHPAQPHFAHPPPYGYPSLSPSPPAHSHNGGQYGWSVHQVQPRVEQKTHVRTRSHPMPALSDREEKQDADGEFVITRSSKPAPVAPSYSHGAQQSMTQEMQHRYTQQLHHQHMLLQHQHLQQALLLQQQSRPMTVPRIGSNANSSNAADFAPSHAPSRPHTQQAARAGDAADVRARAPPSAPMIVSAPIPAVRSGAPHTSSGWKATLSQGAHRAPQVTRAGYHDAPLSSDTEDEAFLASASPSTSDDWSRADDSFIDGLTSSFHHPQMPVQRAPPSIPIAAQTTPRVRSKSAVGRRPSSRPSSSPRAQRAQLQREGGARDHASASPPPPTVRPRTTNGLRNPPVPTLRVGSAGMHRPRPRSSNLISPRGGDPVREAADIFAVTDLFTPSPRAHPPTPTPRTRPPPYTLSLAGSSFYARLPDELWIHTMQYLDTATLLTSVARLDVASRRLVADQEVWHSITLTSSKAAAAPMSARAGPETLFTSAPSAYASLIALARRWTMPHSLDFSGAGAFLRDDFFSKLEQHPLPFWSLTLRELSLARCTLVTDASLQILAPACASLTCLDLSFCGQLTDEGFECIILSCGSSLLKCVLNRCHGLTDSSIRTLATHASSLVELDLTFCTTLTDHALELLASSESRCFYPRASAMAGVATVSTPLAYGGLQKLSLRWCRKVTDVGVCFLMGGGVAPESADQRAAAADASDSSQPVVPIAPSIRRFNALRILNLDHCSLLTDRAMMHISKSALQLQDLSIVFCKLLTPVSFQYLVAGSTHQLHRLVLDHCDLFQSYLSASNVGTLRLLLASSLALRALSSLSFKTCPHAGLERARHQEIEAECDLHTRPQPHSHRGGSVSAGRTSSNVMDLVSKLAQAQLTPRTKPSTVATRW